MSRRIDKQLRELDELEATFQRELAAHLRACAAGDGSLLFATSELRPPHWPSRASSPDADALFAQALGILALRERHGIDATTCLAARYRDACHRYVDFDDHHRPGPRQQAMLLLQTIESQTEPRTP